MQPVTMMLVAGAGSEGKKCTTRDYESSTALPPSLKPPRLTRVAGYFHCFGLDLAHDHEHIKIVRRPRGQVGEGVGLAGGCIVVNDVAGQPSGHHVGDGLLVVCPTEPGQLNGRGVHARRGEVGHSFGRCSKNSRSLQRPEDHHRGKRACLAGISGLTCESTCFFLRRFTVQRLRLHRDAIFCSWGQLLDLCVVAVDLLCLIVWSQYEVCVV